MVYNIRIRKRLVPRTFTDFSAMMFMSFAIPAVYWFEIYVVAPTVYNRVLNFLHTILGTYFVINIIGNFMAIIAVDTSTQGLLLPSQVPPGWHVCATCESTAPPRSRHCITCNVCVLKKEHHCVFAGCCVGLRNHRYFYIFLFLMWVSTLYCSCLNAFFIWPYVGGFNLWAMVRLMLPGIWLVMEPSMGTLFAFLFSINIIGFLFMTVLMYYYTGLLVTNTTTREINDQKGQKYDYGREQNIKVTLGERWYLTWVFPTLSSPLPYDGLEWFVESEEKSVRPKTK
ncbi:probable palmitoyltransferase ZDHHC24 [Procambarus clarkii]|uniref:probable palmitoyltransferase ZDHHC24 n=1 Tax=Procambarus clarkii TaxID=6728 RepID=UPI001E673F0C|nr:probable palmitoyltransferase ZDHHC24 [Procambarus clarkii]XP_045589977.1 probable palmitoyltransferase ZDHHC24 [Procambarus clarkii]